MIPFNPDSKAITMEYVPDDFESGLIRLLPRLNRGMDTAQSPQSGDYTSFALSKDE